MLGCNCRGRLLLAAASRQPPSSACPPPPTMPPALQAPRQGTPEYVAVFGEAPEGQEESLKTAAVRRAYQRALLVPTHQLEALWRGYEGLEMGGSNKQLARRLLDEWRPKYQAGALWVGCCGRGSTAGAGLRAGATAAACCRRLALTLTLPPAHPLPPPPAPQPAACCASARAGWPI